MEKQCKLLYEAMAEVTGKNPPDVEKQMNQIPRMNFPTKSSEWVLISESFPCPPSYASMKSITRDEECPASGFQ